MFCAYKDSLGVPGEGVHAQRIGGLAFWDIIGTIILILGLQAATGVSLWIVTAVMLLFVVFIHKLFCVDTALNKELDKVIGI